MKKNGFTIMEAVIVLGIMSIVLLIGAVPLNSYVTYKNTDTVAFMNKSVTQAVASYYTIKNEFPIHGAVQKGYTSPLANGADEVDVIKILEELEKVTNIVVNDDFDNGRYKANISYVNDYIYKISFEVR